jgi:hypothetical protein
MDIWYDYVFQWIQQHSALIELWQMLTAQFSRTCNFPSPLMASSTQAFPDYLGGGNSYVSNERVALILSFQIQLSNIFLGVLFRFP